MIFVKRKGKINSLIRITKILLMLKIIKIKLEKNLLDFKKGKSCYLKKSASSVANRDVFSRNDLL